MSEFGSAFAAARKAGEKTFTFKGKSYHTTTADDLKKVKKATVTAQRKTAPAPKAKPKTSHMAGIGSAPSSVAKNAALKPATVTAKRKTAAARKPKASAGDNYRKMAASPGGVPGKKKAASDGSGSTVTRVPRGTRQVASSSSSTPSSTGRTAGDNYRKMAARPGGVPGRKR